VHLFAYRLNQAALELLPQNPANSTGRRCLFDLAWYAWMTATVAGVTGHRADYVGWTMPLGLAVHYVVADRRRQGQEIIQATPNEQILARMHQMMAEQLARKGYE
jgi:hypothetical protein